MDNSFPVIWELIHSVTNPLFKYFGSKQGEGEWKRLSQSKRKAKLPLFGSCDPLEDLGCPQPQATEFVPRAEMETQRDSDAYGIILKLREEL